MGDFYGTGIDIWAGFGMIGIAEKIKIWADYKPLLDYFFKVFMGKKELKVCSVRTKKLHEIELFFFSFS